MFVSFFCISTLNIHVAVVSLLLFGYRFERFIPCCKQYIRQLYVNKKTTFEDCACYYHCYGAGATKIRKCQKRKGVTFWSFVRGNQALIMAEVHWKIFKSLVLSMFNIFIKRTQVMIQSRYISTHLV